MNRKTLWLALALAVASSAAVAGKGSNLPAPGEVRTYFQDGVEVGRAVHNPCTGEISIVGLVTDDYIGSFTVSC
ncbi:hypothetical protein [Luteimonas aquatica]|uniref:hypothetical protein n=1 Tax=Luteimonas aquatica TaxID=450364 RepID=UPI001F560402|nr:hypothetical protein [Luteimonas aquatica]